MFREPDGLEPELFGSFREFNRVDGLIGREMSTAIFMIGVSPSTIEYSEIVQGPGPGCIDEGVAHLAASRMASPSKTSVVQSFIVILVGTPLEHGVRRLVVGR